MSPYCVSVHSLCYEQTVMFVNTLRLYKRLKVSLRLEKNFDARLIGPVSIYMVHIGRIYLVIRSRTQNKAEVSFWGVEMFNIQVSFGPQKLLLNINCM